MSHLEAHDLNAAVFYKTIDVAGHAIKLYVVGKNETVEELGYGFKILRPRKEVYFYYRRDTFAQGMQSAVLIQAIDAIVAHIVLNPVRFGLEADIASVRSLYASPASREASFESWTFPQVDPKNLVAAGFFFAPTIERPDRCLCFACPAVFYNWEEGDDPAQEHRKVASSTCPFVRSHLQEPSSPITSTITTPSSSSSSTTSTSILTGAFDVAKGFFSPWSSKSEALPRTPSPAADDEIATIGSRPATVAQSALPKALIGIKSAVANGSLPASANKGAAAAAAASAAAAEAVFEAFCSKQMAMLQTIDNRTQALASRVTAASSRFNSVVSTAAAQRQHTIALLLQQSALSRQHAAAIEKLISELKAESSALSSH